MVFYYLPEKGKNHCTHSPLAVPKSHPANCIFSRSLASP
jgi:hypothetical protein